MGVSGCRRLGVCKASSIPSRPHGHYSRVEKQSYFPRRRYANTPTRRHASPADGPFCSQEYTCYFEDRTLILSGSCGNQPEVRAGVGFSRVRWTARRLKQLALRHLDVPNRKFTEKLAPLLNCKSATKHGARQPASFLNQHLARGNDSCGNNSLDVD